MNQRIVFHIVAGCLLTASIFALYSKSLDVGFLGDDYCFIETSDTWEDVAQSFVGDWFWHDLDVSGARFYRPLQIVFTALELRLWGEDPWGFHLDLLLIHTANSLLIVWLIALFMGDSTKRHPWIPWLAALVFALHPRHSESICMINGRTDSLCAFFYLLSFNLYAQWRQHRLRAFRWASVAFFVFALASKEMAITLPGLILLYELARYRRNRIQSQTALSMGSYLKATIPHWIALALVFGVLRTWALGGYIFGRASYIQPVADTTIYLLSLCKLILVLCLPFEGVIRFFVNRFVTAPEMLGITLTAVIAIAGLSLVVSFFQGSIRWSVGLGFCFIGALPVLTQLTEFQTTLSDRYIYIPSIGIALIIADLLLRVRRIHTAYAAALVIGALVWIGANIPLNAKYVGEWRTAGRIADSIVEQIERLDLERPIGERFCFLSLPVLYQGKHVLNTSFEHYFNYKKMERKKPIRIITSMLQMDMLDPPDEVETDTIFHLDRITHAVRGGYFRFPLHLAHAQIEIVTQSTKLPGREARFKTLYGHNPLILLTYDRGKVRPVSPTTQKVIIAQGSKGKGIVRHFFPYKERGQSRIAIPHNIQQNARISPQRGLHLTAGDVDGDGVDDLVTTLGPTNDPAPLYSGLLFVWKNDFSEFIGHPFSPFPKNNERPIANPLGEVHTAVGRFIPGRNANQIACGQGIGGKQIVRLFEFTEKEQPHGFQLIGQFLGFDAASRGDNTRTGVCLASGDFDGDGVDELVIGQTGASQRPHVQIASLAPPNTEGTVSLRTSSIFEAYPDAENQQNTGLCLTVGDIDNDGLLEIITSPSKPIERQPSTRPSLSIWKVDKSNGSEYACSLKEKRLLTHEDTDLLAIHSIRLSCGNIDLDDNDEIIVGMTGWNDSYRERVIAYKYNSSKNDSTPSLTAAYRIGDVAETLFESNTPLGWLDVAVLR